MTETSGAGMAPAQDFSQQPQLPKDPQFPPHNAPRVWLITNGASPLAMGLARRLLAHGDYIVLGLSPAEGEEDSRRGEEFRQFMDRVRTRGAKDQESRRTSGQGQGQHVHEVLGAFGVDPGGALEDELLQQWDGLDSWAKVNNNKNAINAGKVKMKPWRERIRVVPLDGSSVSAAQAAVAESTAAFGMDVDILLLTTPSTVLGTVEEFGQSAATQALVQDQFEVNFYANVSLIKAVLPSMRKRKNGHIILLSGTPGHFGTPGLATHCASIWAIEGYCDSLAYEVAPFNVKTTIVQPNIEVGTLTNKLTSVPPMAEYSPEYNHAPFQREIIAGLFDRLEGAPSPDDLASSERRDSSSSGYPSQPLLGEQSPTQPEALETPTSHPNTAVPDTPEVGGGLTTGDLLSSPTITTVYPPLPAAMQHSLVAETVFAIAAIGGHDNPPARHIVGNEGIVSVKEKLNTVSEELEDFLEASLAVDFPKPDMDAGAA